MVKRKEKGTSEGRKVRRIQRWGRVKGRRWIRGEEEGA